MEDTIRELIRQIITDTTNSRRVSILEAGNGLAALLPVDHPNRQLVDEVAFEMFEAKRDVFEHLRHDPVVTTTAALV